MRRNALDAIRDEKNITSPKKGGLSVYGTNVLMNVDQHHRGAGNPQQPADLLRASSAEPSAASTSRQTILTGNPTCHACPVACKKEVEIKDGPYKGLKMESVEYEPAWSLGANCDNDDIASIAKLIDQCNDHGLDPIELGNVFSAYMEATERGFVEGPGLAWGDREAMVALTDQLARREGIGDVLAEGAARTAAHFGHPELGMHCKGQAIPAYDPRGLKGMGLGYATSNRGACHLRAYVAAAELGVMAGRGRPPRLAGQGRAREDLPGHPRLLGQPRLLQVQRLRRRSGLLRGAVRRGHGHRVRRGRRARRRRAHLQPRAPLQQPGGLPERDRTPCRRAS